MKFDLQKWKNFLQANKIFSTVQKISQDSSECILFGHEKQLNKFNESNEFFER